MSDRTLVTFDAQKAGRVFTMNNPDAVLADLSVANGYLDRVDAVTVSLDGLVGDLIDIGCAQGVSMGTMLFVR